MRSCLEWCLLLRVTRGMGQHHLQGGTLQEGTLQEGVLQESTFQEGTLLEDTFLEDTLQEGRVSSRSVHSGRMLRNPETYIYTRAATWSIPS